MPSGNKAGKKAAAPTEYVVLEMVTLTADQVGEQLGNHRSSYVVWAPVLNAIAEEGPDGQPRVFLAASKTQAIRQHTGDGADVIEGAWKAIPLSSWKGGETTKRVTASERLPLDAVA